MEHFNAVEDVGPGQIAGFMRGCVAMAVGNGSWLPSLIEALKRATRSGYQTILGNIV